jgi:type IV secretion system protein VirB1
MILPLAVFLHIAVVCAPQIAPATLAAIARTESRLDPYAVHDNATGRSYWPRDKAEAVAIATPLLAAGHSIDVGLMGINAGNWRWLGLTIETVFDPCPNIRAGATVLTAFSRYNTGSPTRGLRNGYVASVIAAGRALPPVSVARAVPVAPAPPPSPDQPAGQPPGQPAGQARGLKADRGLKVHRGRLVWRAYTSSQEPDSWSAFSSSEGKKS